MKKILFVFGSLALAVASAAGSSYRVTLFQPAALNGSELKEGEYKVDVKDNKAIISRGKHVVEAPVKVETNATKYGTTSIRYVNGHIDEIRIGGTNTRLSFASEGTTAGN